MRAKQKKSQSRSQASVQAVTNLEGGTQTSAEKREYTKFLIWLAENTLKEPWDDNFRLARASFLSGWPVGVRRLNIGTKNERVQIFTSIPDEQ